MMCSTLMLDGINVLPRIDLEVIQKANILALKVRQNFLNQLKKT